MTIQRRACFTFSDSEGREVATKKQCVGGRTKSCIGVAGNLLTAGYLGAKNIIGIVTGFNWRWKLFGCFLAPNLLAGRGYIVVAHFNRRLACALRVLVHRVMANDTGHTHPAPSLCSQ